MSGRLLSSAKASFNRPRTSWCLVAKRDACSIQENVLLKKIGFPEAAVIDRNVAHPPRPFSCAVDASAHSDFTFGGEELIPDDTYCLRANLVSPLAFGQRGVCLWKKLLLLDRVLLGALWQKEMHAAYRKMFSCIRSDFQ